MSLWHATGGVGPDLVLLHGWGMNSAVWAPLLPALEARWRVTRIELPGHGESSPLGGGLEAWADACLAVAPEQASWLGWSLGGLVSMAAAKRAPERLHQLCLMSATPSFVQREGWRCAVPAKTFDQFAGNLAKDPSATLRRFLALQVRGSTEARPLLRQLSEALEQRPDADPVSLRDGLRLLLEGDLREALHSLAVPVACLLGERDTLVPASVAEELAPVPVEVVSGASHAPFLSHPYDFIAWLERACGR